MLTCDTDPTRDIVLPSRPAGEVRALVEGEVVELRHRASFIDRPRRHGAAAALALAGGHSAEIGHIRVCDLDLEGRRVWMHGATKTDARWCSLDDWSLNVLAHRAKFVSARQLRPELPPRPVWPSPTSPPPTPSCNRVSVSRCATS
ncbi:hypothetical protein ABTX71_35270 [Streptomyces parvulus]|uniref:hypothetical protein n=1 Tax=Streptomyces parvulus TaxID=146923 RepID=UPI003326E198